MAGIKRNIVRGVSVLLTGGGALIFGRSITNPNPIFENEMKQRGAIVLEMREKYGVNVECFSTGAWGGANCYEQAGGNYTQAQREEVLRRYSAETQLRQQAISINEAAHRQAQRDGLGMLVGLPATTIGILGLGLSQEEGRKGRQFRGRIERRKGRGKEGM